MRYFHPSHNSVVGRACGRVILALLAAGACAASVRARGEPTAACEAEWRRLAATPALVRFHELTMLKAGAWQGAEPVALEPRLREALAVFHPAATATESARTGPVRLDELVAALIALDRIHRHPANGLEGRLNGTIAGHCRYWAGEMLLVELSLIDPVQVALAAARAPTDRATHEDALAALYEATQYRRRLGQIRSEIARLRPDYARLCSAEERLAAAARSREHARQAGKPDDRMTALCRALANHEAPEALAELRQTQNARLQKTNHPRRHNEQNWSAPFRKDVARCYCPVFTAEPRVQRPVAPVLAYLARAQDQEAVDDIARIAADTLIREGPVPHLNATRALDRRLAAREAEIHRLLQTLPAHGEYWDYLQRAAGSYKHNRDYLVRLTALGLSDEAADRLLAFHDRLPPGHMRWRLLWSCTSSARSPRIAAAVLSRAVLLEDTQQRYHVLSLLIAHAGNHNDALRAALTETLKQPADGAEDLQLRVLANALAAGLPVSRERLKAAYLKTPETRRKIRMTWLGRRLKADLEDERKFLQWIDKQPEMLEMR